MNTWIFPDGNLVTKPMQSDNNNRIVNLEGVILAVVRWVCVCVCLATPSRNRSFFALKKNPDFCFCRKNAGKNLNPRYFFYQALFWVMPFLFFPFFFLFFFSSSCLLPLLIFVFFFFPLILVIIIIIIIIIIMFFLLLSPSDSRSLLLGSLDSVAHFQLPFPAQSSIVFRVIYIDLRRYWVL